MNRPAAAYHAKFYRAGGTNRQLVSTVINVQLLTHLQPPRVVFPCCADGALALPLVVDTSPCISFNVDEQSPIMDRNGQVLGYMLLKSGAANKPPTAVPGPEDDGHAVMEVVVTLTEASGLFFASTTRGADSGSNSTGNVRALYSNFVPNACPSKTNVTADLQATADCTQRAATLRFDLPIGVVNCSAYSPEPHYRTFLMQLGVSVSTRVSCNPLWAMAWHGCPVSHGNCWVPARPTACAGR